MSRIETLTEKLKHSEDKLEHLEATVNDETNKLRNETKVVENENVKLKKYRDKIKEELKLNKTKLKDSEEKVAQLEDILNVKVKDTSCQTKAHPDIPYRVSSPLPPIFSLQLCHKSRPIFLSDSLPNLDSVCWCKPNEDFKNEAEEALAEQYDRRGGGHKL
jgi:hypothetical protein